MEEGTVSLTDIDLRLLCDRVKSVDIPPDGMRFSPYDLIKKLGSAYLEQVPENGNGAGDIPVMLSEGEVFHLLDRVSSNDASPLESRLGIKLRRKLLTLLLSMDCVIPFTEGEVDGGDKRLAKPRLDEWAKQQQQPEEGAPA